MAGGGVRPLRHVVRRATDGAARPRVPADDGTGPSRNTGRRGPSGGASGPRALALGGKRSSRNVEVKVAVARLLPVRRAVEALGARGAGEVHQTDTYFGTGRCARLKLREQEPGGAELIAYSRPDHPGLRRSEYRRWPARDPAGLAAALDLALGVRARVVKRRRVYLVGRTRVHLDELPALGRFVELEVLLAPRESPAAGRREAEGLLRRLGLAAHKRIAGSYADLAQCPS